MGRINVTYSIFAGLSCPNYGHSVLTKCVHLNVALQCLRRELRFLCVFATFQSKGASK